MAPAAAGAAITVAEAALSAARGSLTVEEEALLCGLLLPIASARAHAAFPDIPAVARGPARRFQP